MTTNISEHQVRVYMYAKATADWFTIQDLATDSNVPENSAKSHAERFEELGIFKRLRVAPHHLFRLASAHEVSAIELVERLEEAAPVFEARRKNWLVREASSFGLTPPVLPAIAAPKKKRASAGANEGGAGAPLHPPQANRDDKKSGRGSGKVDLLFSLIARREGASLDELAAKLGNQRHSVRATISVKSRERGVTVRCDAGRYFLD